MAGESKWPDGRTSQDWYDVAGLLREMEQATGYSITITLSSAGNAERPDLRMVLTSVPSHREDMEAPPSAYVSFLCSAQRLASLKGLCSFALYQTDFLSALDEREAAA